MEVSIEQHEFAAALQAAARVASTRSVLPVTLGARLRVAGNSISIATTDSTVYLETPVPLASQAKQEGTVIVPAHQLADLIRRIPSGLVELKRDGGALRVSFGESGAYRVPIIPGQFPEPPAPDGDSVTFTIPSESLATAISGVAGAAAPEGSETVSIFSGVQFGIGPDGFAVSATDRSRIARYFDPAITNSEAVEFVIPAKPLLDFVKSLPAETDITITVDSRGIYTSVSGRSWSIRLLAGAFPDLGSLLKQFEKTAESPSAVVHRADLVGAITRLIGVNNTEPLVEFLFKDSAIIAQTEDPGNGSGVERLQAELSGEEGELAFNGRFINESLKHLDSDEVLMEFIQHGGAAPGHANRMARFMSKGDDKLTFHIAPTVLPSRTEASPAIEKEAS